MSAFLEHFAENEDGRKYHRPVTSHTAQPLPALCGKPYEPCSGSRIKTGPADWLLGKEMCELLFLGGKGLLLPMACSLQPRLFQPGTRFTDRDHPLGPLKVEIISFLMWVPLWRKPSGRSCISAPSARSSRPEASSANAEPHPRTLTFSPHCKAGRRFGQLHKGSDPGHYRPRGGGKSIPSPSAGSLVTAGEPDGFPRLPSPWAHQETRLFLNPPAPWPP